ncbi:single-stranded DNA-binding protein [Curtobacterium sp. MCPF17_002]|uniref:single-stranded DNA-binding protein n=1 Tax=Curtobacterium sp. MCPF17_002 TaxID=2175645 RepID=UPI000DA81A3F|nr:single-stranded DNA-binding protein [Curtobacterium sp. MCPF17_002]WIB78520.1 single-stranded DNA-binding protein [Curtobacterium sp. MCPF17_002]
MNDTITVCGIIATEPRHLVTDTGIAITSMRLASPSRRWDRATSTWTNGATNWYSVTAFRTLAANVHKSVKKGDRIVVTGRVRIRTWERDGRGGTSIEIDAEGLGHDLAWGISNWIRVPRHSSESAAAPGSSQGRVNTVDLRTGEVHGITGTGTPPAIVGADDHDDGRDHDDHADHDHDDHADHADHADHDHEHDDDHWGVDLGTPTDEDGVPEDHGGALPVPTAPAVGDQAAA